MGEPNISNPTSVGYGCNCAGAPVGAAQHYYGPFPSGFVNYSPYKWTSTGSATRLPDFPGGYGYYSYDINDFGFIVGQSYLRPFFFDPSNPTVVTILPVPAGFATDSVQNAARAIQHTVGSGASSRLAVGRALKGSTPKPVAWNTINLGASEMQTIGGTLGSGGYANAVNAYGNIAGKSQDANGIWKATFWNDSIGLAFNLGAINGAGNPSYASEALGINGIKHMAGWSQNSATAKAAFLKKNNTINSFTTLSSLGGTNTLAFALNDRDEVVGEGTDGSNTAWALLWLAPALKYA